MGSKIITYLTRESKKGWVTKLNPSHTIQIFFICSGYDGVNEVEFSKGQNTDEDLPIIQPFVMT